MNARPEPQDAAEDVDIADLWESMRGPVEAAMSLEGQLCATVLLCPHRLVPDAPIKLLITTRDGRKAAVLRVAPACAPDAVAQESQLSQQARDLLGPALGCVVLEPLLAGRVWDRSYTVLPYCRTISACRPVRALQQLWLVPRLFRWLRGVTAQTLAEASDQQIEADFAIPLRFLSRYEPVGFEIRQQARRALGLLHGGGWRPRHVLAHNDLWRDNILIPPRRWPRSARFVLIDWGGAKLRGHAIYDLVRLAGSVKAPRWWLRRELHRHCQILATGTAGAKGYLLASLGYLAMNLNCFPVERYVACARDSCRQFDLMRRRRRSG